MNITPITFDKRDLERADYDIEKVLGRPSNYMHGDDKRTFVTWSIGPVVLTRDSEIIDQANYKVLVASLKAAEEAGDIEAESYSLNRASHWAVGWVEHLSFMARAESGVRHVVLGKFADTEGHIDDNSETYEKYGERFAYSVLAEDADDAIDAVKTGPLAGCKDYLIVGVGTGSDFKVSIPVVDVARMTRVGRWVHAWLGMLQEYPVASDDVFYEMETEASYEAVKDMVSRSPFRLDIGEQRVYELLEILESRESLGGEYPREDKLREAVVKMYTDTRAQASTVGDLLRAEWPDDEAFDDALADELQETSEKIEELIKANAEKEKS